MLVWAGEGGGGSVPHDTRVCDKEPPEIFPAINFLVDTRLLSTTIFVVMGDWAKEYAKRFHSGSTLGGGAVLKPIPEPKPKFVPIVITPKKGYVYYAGDGNGRVKIGQSLNPWARVSEMRCHNPTISVLAIEKCDDCYALERQRHEQFRDEHLVLEWFKLSDRLDDWIKSIAATHELAKKGSLEWNEK